MSRIPNEEIERVKREIDLEALIRSKGIELKKHGSKDLAAKCPFHEESTASFIVSPHKNLWHCLGCGKGGSVIDFIMHHDGISFRHAYERLAHGGKEILFRANAPLKCSMARRLENPVAAVDADDQSIITQVIDYYYERLKSEHNAAARNYLEKRGISEEAINHFRIGFADRSLGLRLPITKTKDGAAVRERLKHIGLIREESGHEHFNGCVVFPIQMNGEITEIYGRKIVEKQRTGNHHLYLPGAHRGFFNEEALEQSREIILCEAVIDALTFWCQGIRNVTATYGNQGFTEEMKQAFIERRIEKVCIAYDRDAAGDSAAERDAQWFISKGIECLRVRFPSGMDVNEYARKVLPADKSLRLAIQSAEWLGKGRREAKEHAERNVEIQDSPASPAVESDVDGERSKAPYLLAANKLAADAEPGLEKEAQPKPGADPACSNPDAGNRSESETKPGYEEAAKKKSDVPNKATGIIEKRGEDLVLTLDEGEKLHRSYRVRGLEKNAAADALRVNIRLMHRGLYHVNVIDLYQAKQRHAFIEEAARETLLDPELIKRDLGKLLLQLEEVQARQIETKTTVAAPIVAMEEDDRLEALKLLKDPSLLERILADFEACGVIGENTNKLVGYLASVSRKFTKPLGVIIQSTSAAGKTTLMEAILAFTPEEERVKYSAMTGQALFYLGEQDIAHKILAIAEEEGAEKATYALKLLQSEGELTIASTGKDESGRLRTETYHVKGPAMIFFTTTSIELDEELANRCLTLTVDESREQTRRIHELQREEEAIQGYLRAREADRLRKLHQNAQRLLQTLPVHNPFAKQLTFPNNNTRLRRDQKKYLTLIRAIAFLHQHQRPGRMVQGVEHIEVTIDDIAVANRLADEVLGRSLDEMPPQTRRFLDLLHEMVSEKKPKAQEDRSTRADLFTQREARAYTGWSAFQVKKHIARLAELEYVLAYRWGSGNAVTGSGQQIRYELVYSGEGRDRARFLMGLIDVDELRGSMLPLHYDPNREPLNGNREPLGSPQVAPRERCGSAHVNGWKPSIDAGCEAIGANTR